MLYDTLLVSDMTQFYIKISICRLLFFRNHLVTLAAKRQLLRFVIIRKETEIIVGSSLEEDHESGSFK